MCYRKTRLRVLVNALCDQKRCGGGFNGTLVTATAWRLKPMSLPNTNHAQTQEVEIVIFTFLFVLQHSPKMQLSM